MVNLPDPMDIDRVLLEEREKFDLGFSCGCQRGWYELINNPGVHRSWGVYCSSVYQCGQQQKQSGGGDLWNQFTPKVPVTYFCFITALIYLSKGGKEVRWGGSGNQEITMTPAMCWTLCLEGHKVKSCEQVRTNYIKLNLQRTLRIVWPLCIHSTFIREVKDKV